MTTFVMYGLLYIVGKLGFPSFKWDSYQLNSHAYKVYINSGTICLYSNILTIFNQTVIVKSEDMDNGTSSTWLHGQVDLQKV